MSIVVLLFVCLQSVCLDAVCISGMSLLHVPRGYLMDGGQCSPARGAPASDWRHTWHRDRRKTSKEIAWNCLKLPEIVMILPMFEITVFICRCLYYNLENLKLSLLNWMLINFVCNFSRCYIVIDFVTTDEGLVPKVLWFCYSFVSIL